MKRFFLGQDLPQLHHSTRGRYVLNIRFFFFSLLLSVSLSITLGEETLYAAAIAKTPIDGFRGISWGDTVNIHRKDLIDLGSTGSSLMDIAQGNNKMYKRVADAKTIGGQYVGDFFYEFDEYGFWRAGCMVTIADSTKLREKYPLMPRTYNELEKRFIKIHETCVARWGAPEKTVTVIDGFKIVIYEWIYFSTKADDFAIAEIRWEPNREFANLSLNIYTHRGDERQRARYDKLKERTKREF